MWNIFMFNLNFSFSLSARMSQLSLPRSPWSTAKPLVVLIPATAWTGQSHALRWDLRGCGCAACLDASHTPTRCIFFLQMKRIWGLCTNILCHLALWEGALRTHVLSPELPFRVNFHIHLDGWCQLQIGTCHLPLQGLNHALRQLLTFTTPWKELRVESRNEALCALGKTGRTGLQIVRYFQEPILWAQFLNLLISRKALKSFMVTSAPWD